MALAALVIDGIFGAANLVPHSRPTRSDVFMPIGLDYKLVLNVLGLVLFAALIALTLRRGATDPMCGMTVDRARKAPCVARTRRRHVSTSAGRGCRERFEVRARGLEPPRAVRPNGT